MMITQAIKTWQKLIICDETYFVHVHLLVLLLKFKYSINAQIWNMFCSNTLTTLACFTGVMP
jgi:hypothetical protein